MRHERGYTMETNMNALFENENQETTTSTRSLAGTAQLTATASEVTHKIISYLNDNLEDCKEQFAASKSDHSAMDALINQIANLADIDIEFIKALDEEVIDGMLKSQQSKRSRAKGKTMTLDNYRSMMTAAVAENLIRLATGKEKLTGISRRTGDVTFTDEELVELKEDQERLRKELRNVQSKKSIMKSKADFSEESEGWQQLLIAEQQLKSIRTSAAPSVIKVDETKDKLAELLGDIDTTGLKASDSKDLLARVKELIGQ